MADNILEAQNLHKQFGDFTAVNKLSFDIERGTVFSLLGPNGAGKTTTISMLSCLIKPSSGDVAINGHSVIDDSMAVKQLIGVVPQDLALYESLTAWQNLAFWGRLYGLDGATIKRRSQEVLDRVQLTDRAQDRVETYSGGMKRRLNIAAGLLHKPELLFMDEPTVGIDPQSRRRILDFVIDLKNEGMTILYTTHYMEEAEELSDRVGIVDHGRLIALGTQNELKKQVGEKETLRLHVASNERLDALAGQLVSSSKAAHAAAAPSTNTLTVTIENASEGLADILSVATDLGVRVKSIDIQEPNLETVFLNLTGRALRD